MQTLIPNRVVSLVIVERNLNSKKWFISSNGLITTVEVLFIFNLHCSRVVQLLKLLKIWCNYEIPPVSTKSVKLQILKLYMNVFPNFYISICFQSQSFSQSVSQINKIQGLLHDFCLYLITNLKFVSDLSLYYFVLIGAR